MPLLFPSKKIARTPPSTRIPMAKTSKIIRRSIYTFLRNYQYFTTTAAVLAIPFSASILLSQALVVVPSSSSSSSLLPSVYNRLKTLFHAAGFPPSSEFFNILSLKLSQTISSSIFTSPFSLTFLLLAKASTIQALKQQHKPNFPPSFSSLLSIFNPLFFTYICNSLLILSANTTVFSLLFIAFNFLEGSGFSFPNSILTLTAAGAVLYSFVLANALIITNLALVISGMESCSGYLAILKACVLMRGRTSAALSLALPANLVLAGIEALFQYRIVRAYRLSGMASASMAFEVILIAYLYSVSVVLDTVISCMFYESCKIDSWIEQEDGISYSYQIEMAEEDKEGYLSLKNCEEIA